MAPGGRHCRHPRFPLPGSTPATVAAPAPGKGTQYWAGAPSAAVDDDGTIVVGYRVRNGPEGLDETVIARSEDGERLTTVATLDKDHFGAQWTERPALVRIDGGWRMYVGCATPNTKHWWIGVLDASTLEELVSAEVRTAFEGDELTAVKDPIVRVADGVWHAWICCQMLDRPGEEDRMNTAYATSSDGLAWDWHGTIPAFDLGFVRDDRMVRLVAVLVASASALALSSCNDADDAAVNSGCEPTRTEADQILGPEAEAITSQDIEVWALIFNTWRAACR